MRLFYKQKKSIDAIGYGSISTGHLLEAVDKAIEYNKKDLDLEEFDQWFWLAKSMIARMVEHKLSKERDLEKRKFKGYPISLMLQIVSDIQSLLITDMFKLGLDQKEKEDGK